MIQQHAVVGEGLGRRSSSVAFLTVKSPILVGLEMFENVVDPLPYPCLSIGWQDQPCRPAQTIPASPAWAALAVMGDKPFCAAAAFQGLVSVLDNQASCTHQRPKLTPPKTNTGSLRHGLNCALSEAWCSSMSFNNDL